MKIMKEYKKEGDQLMVFLTKKDIEFATELGKKRSASMGHKDTKNSKNFFTNKPMEKKILWR